MKTFYLIIVILISPLIVISQNLVEENKKWNITSFTFWGGNSTTTFSLKLEGDTIINGYSYKQVWESNDSLNNEWIPKNTFLREDSLNRVYKYSWENESLLYDFSMNIGDTIFIEKFCSAILQEKDSVILNNGEIRERFILKPLLEIPSLNTYWVQGIGSIKGGLLDYYGTFCYADYPLEFLCYSENQEVLYQKENASTCYINTVDILEIPDQVKLDIYPNPTTNMLFINSEKDINLTIKIIDIFGKMRLSTSYKKSKSLNLENFENGIYVINVYHNDKLVYLKKIVKK